jgi:hypothetical protein
VFSAGQRYQQLVQDLTQQHQNVFQVEVVVIDCVCTKVKLENYVLLLLCFYTKCPILNWYNDQGNGCCQGEKNSKGILFCSQEEQ